MNFLDLVKRLRSEAGIPGTGPTTVLNQTGQMERLVNWVSQAWVDIQLERPDWEWMRKTKTFNTVASKQSYHPTAAAPDLAMTNFGRWKNDSFRIYLTSAGKGTERTIGQEHNYDRFRDYWLLGSRTTTYGQPIVVSIAPDRSLVFGLGPNDVYTVSGEYYRSPQVLAADADIPEFDEQFHMLIVYEAMKKHGMFDVASEQVQSGLSEYARLKNRLEFDQGPKVFMGSSLI